MSSDGGASRNTRISSTGAKPAINEHLQDRAQPCLDIAHQGVVFGSTFYIVYLGSNMLPLIVISMHVLSKLIVPCSCFGWHHVWMSLPRRHMGNHLVYSAMYFISLFIQ